jgi:hypothetical protein
LGGIIGGLIGQQQAQGQAAAANNNANQANQILQQIQAAPDISAPLILQQYAQSGVLTPEMEQQITAQLPASITTSPQYQQAQTTALQQMQQRATSGLTAADRAALTQANLQTQAGVQGQLGAIQNQMQQQGTADSGTSLAMKLAAAQSGQNQLAQNASNVAQQSQNAAMNAAGQLGQMGSAMQQQQFQQQFQQQQANEQMQRFNIQNQLGVQQQNTQAANQAQAANLANQQSLANQNVSTANQAAQQNKQNALSQYGANVNTAQIQAGGYNNLAGLNQQQAQQSAQAGANIGAGIGALVNPAASTGLTNLVNGFAQGGEVKDFRSGGTVPGQAKVPGDHPANDTVKAMLSPQEIVVPRSLADSKLGRELVKLIKAHNSVKGHLNRED